MPEKTSIAIFISGRGSNMKSLVEAIEAGDIPAEVKLVVANDPAAGGLQWALEKGIPTFALDHRPFGKDREAHERAIDAELQKHGIEFICLAGYMRILTPFIVEKWSGRMINIHPSLLPKYRGLHTHERAIEAGDTEAGCTVHWVTPGVDEGEIILQARVPIREGDTPETLSQRVLAEEHKLYPAALKRALNV